ncbi:MAG: hypothetical protein WDM89_03850 [Rhizomicrobium sp.]
MARQPARGARLPLQCWRRTCRITNSIASAKDGQINKRHDYFAPDDLEALERAKQICGPDEIEVWQGARFVARVAIDGEASIVLSKGPHAD